MNGIRIFNAVVGMWVELGGYFINIIGQMNMIGIWYGAILVAMASGFLLHRFGSSLSLGSDKAAQHFKRKGDK